MGFKTVGPEGLTCQSHEVGLFVALPVKVNVSREQAVFESEKLGTEVLHRR